MKASAKAGHIADNAKKISNRLNQTSLPEIIHVHAAAEKSTRDAAVKMLFLP